MPTLLLRLQGPMQSWGTTSRFDERDTQLEPSKSGVLGVVCAALGRDRSDPVDDVATLRMGVRVDREGVPLRDYQTATGVLIAASGKADLERTVVSPRYYLSDAAFLVGLEGEGSLLQRIHCALKNPVWLLSLGRKGFLPSLPIYMPDAVVGNGLEDALASWPSLLGSREAEGKCRYVIEDDSEGSVRLDQPVAPFIKRRFGPRFVKTTYR